MSKDLVVLMCPPFSDYPNPPEDHSHSELFDCPRCNEKMWLSDKKKGALTLAACMKTETLLGCYPCIKKYVEEQHQFFKQFNKVDL